MLQSRGSFVDTQKPPSSLLWSRRYVTLDESNHPRSTNSNQGI